MLFVNSGGESVNTWRHILHPTDFSGASRRAFRWAIQFGRQHGAEVVVMHVLTTSAYEADLIGWPAFYEAYQADRRRRAERAIAALVATAQRRGVNARGLVLEGVPAREIPRRAASMRADVVMMGTHGGRGIQRLLFGSIADAVIRRAPCPVLTVRAGSILTLRKHDRQDRAAA
jgi:nucleotide-binding universal stress UspA family protein